MSIRKKLSLWLNVNRGISNRNDKASVFNWVWGYVTTSQIEGDYIEFGVYQGNTFIESWRQWKFYEKWVSEQLKSSEEWRKKTWSEYSNNKPQFYGIDSFSGIPENYESDVHFSEGTYSAEKEYVYKRCVKNGMDNNQFKLIESFYSALTVDELPDKASVIHIDSDLYQSAIEALRLCRKSIQQGTVVLFDDYNCFSASNDQGERKALKEFSAETGIIFEPWFSYRNVGQVFLCHLE
jgi:hypothetical protein